MPISGLVVRVDPACRATVIEALNQLEHVELAPTPPGETLVAVLDVATLQEEETLFSRISDLPGVSNVTLSYHNFEDLNPTQCN